MKKTLFACVLFAVSILQVTAQINLAQGLVSYHPFTGNANDAGPNAIHGNVSNATLTSDRNGNANSAYYFNGNAFIDLPNNNAYSFSPQGTFSISVWVLPDQNNTWPAQAVVVKAPLHTDFNMSAWNYGTYIFSYKAMSGYAYNHILNGSTTFVQNLCWYNITSTYDNGKWHLYVNGRLEDQNLSQTNFILQDGFSRIFFGKKGESNGDWYQGKMDEVRIYNRVLNQQEIDSLAHTAAGTKTVNDLSLCEGESVQLSASGANSYSWSPATGLSNSSVANPVASPTATTRYFVTGADAAGCTSTDNLLITVNPTPVVSVSNDSLVCENSIVPLNATGGIQYSWLPSAGLSNSNIANPVATAVATTKYVVTVTNNNGCTAKDSVVLSVRKTPVFDISPAADACIKKSAQLTASGGDIYLWTPGISLNNPALFNPIASPVVTTIYSVTITDTICRVTNTLSTQVKIWPAPGISIQKTGDVDCSNGSSQLTAAGGITYSWQADPTLSNPDIANPVASPTATTTYYVNITDQHGCTNSDSVIVYVTTDNKSGYYIPTAFTPNNDGVNDCYGIRYWGSVNEIDFSIYNRWGQRVFHAKRADACWDGKLNGIAQDAAVYVYVIKAKTNCGDVFRKGTMVLIR